MNTTHTARRARLAVLASGALLAAPLLLTGCAQADGPAAGSGSSSETSQKAESGLTLSDSWAKANAGSEMESMSAVFGTLKNNTDKEVTLESAESASAGTVELHETDGDGKMREKKGGFTIPAGGELQLAPGGDHIMLMEMPKPIKAGEEVEATLHFSDGATLKVQALVKDYSGGNESYDGGMDHGSEDGGMDHASH
ncbi:copper chaperone PCu(A)C [Leucobacter luti]|uniref:copper chaperone PCu(A)C n=1 Tax=Leucobacter luti TaxID=340320 RepID=UPI003CFFFE1D